MGLQTFRLNLFYVANKHTEIEIGFQDIAKGEIR